MHEQGVIPYLFITPHAHVQAEGYVIMAGVHIYILLASERSERDTLRSVQLKIRDIYLMVLAISVYSAVVPYAARFTRAVKIPLSLATFSSRILFDRKLSESYFVRLWIKQRVLNYRRNT